MAVDYGDARTGIAVSDESATLVGEAWVIRERSLAEVASVISLEARLRGVGVVVIGHPINMNGTVGPRASISAQLAEVLRELCEMEVVLWDERMTTMSAHRILTDTGRHGKKRKNTIDAVAASLILEGYLQFLSNLETDLS